MELIDILDSEKRRAQNLIWNAAGDYSFEPEFKAYDEEGRADLYWNSIIGAVRKNYGQETIDALLESFQGCKDQVLYEELAWLALENAVFLRESPHRPALLSLRRNYARRVLALGHTSDQTLNIVENAHFRRVLGEDPSLRPWEQKLLDTLELPGDLDGSALAEHILGALRSYFGFIPGETQAAEAKEKKHRFSFGRRKGRAELPAIRSFSYGYGEHAVAGSGGKETSPPQRLLTDLTAAQSETALRTYVQNIFGPPLYGVQQLQELEQALCADSHKGCHLYYARGDNTLDPQIKGYAGSQRRIALKQMERNKAAYEADAVRHRNSILRLTARIRNAMLAYLQPMVVRAASGQLDASRIWRGLYLDDDKVFTRVLRTDPGDISVDLLLDSSTSQVDRQAAVAAQGYMIAESLTCCGIPVRVSSFCSLSGYTILTRYRDYNETDKNERIFHYFTTGCNRDGLAIRALGLGLEDSPCEHRIVILLSDAKPNDVVKMVQGDTFLDYTTQNGIENTAREVRALLHREVSVICVFTGDDEDVPAAHTIYGRDFARIRSLDQFADTVGTLIQNQIRSL